MNPPPGILALPNGQWVLEKDSHISRWAEQHGTIVSDPHLMRFLKPYMEKAEVVWSVGANIGDHARQFADWGKQVVAIEPNPLAYTCLEHNCSDCLCLPYAASDKDGSLNFTLLENAGASRVTEKGEWSVECKRLDGLGLPDPDFIVMDVEGHEVFALRGMSDVLKRRKPTMFVEVNKGALATNGHTRFDIAEFMRSCGYSIGFSSLLHFPSNMNPEDPQYDWLFLPE